MSALYQLLYYNIFSVLFIPVFIIMIIGAPKFLIKLIKVILDYKEKRSGIQISKAAEILLILNATYSYLCFYQTNDKLKDIFAQMASGEKLMTDDSYFDDKLRQVNLFERNSYMFITYAILIIIFEAFCDVYVILWNTHKNAKLIKIESKMLKKIAVEKANLNEIIENIDPNDQTIKENVLNRQHNVNLNIDPGKIDFDFEFQMNDLKKYPMQDFDILKGNEFCSPIDEYPEKAEKLPIIISNLVNQNGENRIIEDTIYKEDKEINKVENELNNDKMTRG